jgi:hypothetical protein
MSNLLSIPVPTGTPSLCWSGRQSGSISTIMFYNPDPDNYVYLGQESNITAAGPNSFPLAPNGSFSGDPSENWYVIGYAATQPLIMIPNGQSFQVSLTQGYGSIVIPLIYSPNFVEGVSGWYIGKDGDAEFNNLVIRGIFYGLNYEVNSSGAFFYSGTPAFGNLVIALANSAGTDSFGNPYPSGVSTFNGGITSTLSNGQLSFTPFGGAYLPALVFSAAGVLVLEAPEESASDGLTQVNVYSRLAAAAQTLSNCLQVSDSIDGQVYGTQRLSLVLTAATANSTTTFAPFFSVSVEAASTASRTYRVHGKAYYTANQSAGDTAIEWTGPAGTTGLISFTASQKGQTAFYDCGPLGNGGSSGSIPITMNTADPITVEYDGAVTVPAGVAGSFELLYANVTGSDTFKVAAGSFADIMPV